MVWRSHGFYTGKEMQSLSTIHHFSPRTMSLYFLICDSIMIYRILKYLGAAPIPLEANLGLGSSSTTVPWNGAAVIAIRISGMDLI